ncbi:MAG TPA: GAF domain-containing protein [Phycisphaerales bacterium]|nr:GAF domain-containing protein [Phycisphaerales bacterium]
MPAAPKPYDEPERTQALDECGILDTPPEPSFDALTALARRLCGAPLAFVSLVDRNRQWFKSHCGTSTSETPREGAFCSYVVFTADAMVVEDATKDPRMCDSPLVTGRPFIRAYAGFPITTRDGLTLGSFCIVDTVPRCFTPDQLNDLKSLALVATELLELRRDVASLSSIQSSPAASDVLRRLD